MSDNHNPTSFYEKEYNSLSALIRDIYLRGYYAADMIREKHGLKKNKYSLIKQFLQIVFGERLSGVKRDQPLHFTAEGFESPDNFLLDIYNYMRSSDSIRFVKFLHIIADRNNKSFKKAALIEKLLEYDADTSEKTYERFISSIERNYLSYDPEKKDAYRLISQPLDSLDEEELVGLNELTDLCRNVYHPATLAHYLRDTLSFINDRYEIKYESIFQCKHLHMCQVLDDPTMWDIITAIHEGQIIRFSYGDKGDKRILQPYRIIINENDGRRYAWGISWGKIRIYRLDRIISNIEIIEKPYNMSILSEEEMALRLRDNMSLSMVGISKHKKDVVTGTLLFNGRAKTDVLRMFPDVIPEKADDRNYKIDFRINSGKDIKPFLRQHIKDITLVLCSDNTIQELHDELIEWRKMYGIR